MTTLIDVTPDLPPAHGLSPVRDLSAAEVSTLAEELLADHQHFAPLFRRREQREWAAFYLRGLLTADVPRKNVEAMALRLLLAGPHAQRQVRAVQQFVGEGGWDDEAILAEHQRQVVETLGDEEGVFIIDGSEFPKHGAHSVGVASQWCGHTGKQDNCQAGVFLGYASRKGATLLDRRLYLPESWFEEDHQPLWRACRIPETIAFQTKHAPGRRVGGAGHRLWADHGEVGSCATRAMVTRRPSWNVWPGQDGGIWPRSRGIRRSGPCLKPMDRPPVRVPAVGYLPRPAHAKDPLPDASDCIPPARPKSRWRTWPKRGPPPPGSAFGCWRGTKARWLPISSRCVLCCHVIACLAQSSGW